MVIRIGITSIVLSLMGATTARGQAGSALDNLDPAAIPALERFDWHPKELVAILGEHRGRQGSVAQSVAYNPDGKLLASGGSNGAVRIWDRATMRQRHVMGTSTGVARLAFFADGKTLAACTAGASVQLWDMSGKEPTPKKTLQKGSTAYYALAVSPNGRYVAAGGADTEVRVWLLEDKADKLIAEMFGHTGPVTGLAFSPGGKTLVSSSNDGTIRLWSINGEKVENRGIVRTQESAIRSQELKQEMTCVAFSEAGTLASGGSDGMVRLWDLNVTPPREKTIIPTKAGHVTSIAFGPRGTNLLASAHTDYSVRVWTLGTAPRQKSLLEGHTAAVYDVAFAPGKSGVTQVASAGGDWTVRQWPISGPKPRDKAIGKGHLSHAYDVAFAPDGKTLVSGSYDTSLRLWEVAGKAVREHLVWKKDPVQTYALAFSPNGKGVAYGGSDTAVRLWEPQRRWIVRKFLGHPGQISSLAFSPDGRLLLSTSLNSIRLYDVATGEGLRELKGHTKNVSAAVFSPDGRYILSGGGGYDYDGNQIRVVNGKYVYVDCTTRLWDADSGKEIFNLKDQEFPVLSVAFAPSGSQIAYGVQEPALRVFDLMGTAPGKMRKLQAGAYSYPHCVRYAPDGKTLVTVGLDGKVILWDANSLKRLREWTFNEANYRAAYAPDSRHLAVPVATGVVYLLRLPAP